MANVTVAEVNKAFAAKGLHITLPLAEDVVVAGIDILERQKTPGSIKVLMRVKFINEKGREEQDIFVCEGKTDVEKKFVRKTYELPKKTLLPKRDHITFESDAGALEYIKQAIIHLLQDKEYPLLENPASDLYFEKDGKGFYINLALRLDDAAFERAKALVELRRSLREKAGQHDFGIVVPSIQESLGLALRLQERWVSRNQDYLSVQRIGVYGVDNGDPNTIYPFTIYPSMLELKRYFMVTSQQWALVRSRYVLERARKEREAAGESSDMTASFTGMGVVSMGGMGGMSPAGGTPGQSTLPPLPPPPPLPPMPDA